MNQTIDALQKRRAEIGRKMALEEQHVTAYHQLRESYHKMLVSRFSFMSEDAIWRKACRLAARDYLQRIEEMRALYVKLEGSEAGFQAPMMHGLVSEKFP